MDISKMQNEEDLKKKFTKKMTRLYDWPEDKVKSLLKTKLEVDGWEITEIHWGREQGRDMVAAKNNRSIIFETKGEPKSPTSEYTERRHFVRDSLSTLISYMVTEDANCKYCVVFPNNELYVGHVLKQFPLLVRKKLDLHALFVNADGSAEVLFPGKERTSKLLSFDSLF